VDKLFEQFNLSSHQLFHQCQKWYLCQLCDADGKSIDGYVCGRVEGSVQMIQIQAIEAANTELDWQDSGREKVVEQNFRSILRVHLDDVEKYGLEHCLYFQTIRIFCKVYFFLSFLSIFQILFALQGKRFSDDDLCSRLATLTMGNVDETTSLSAGTLRFRLSSGDSSMSFSDGWFTWFLIDARNKSQHLGNSDFI